jgi:hypothetical protein
VGLSAGSKITITQSGNTLIIGGGTGYAFFESTTAPTGFSAGDRWFDTDLGKLFTAVTDGLTAIWVEFGGTDGATGFTELANTFGPTQSFTNGISSAGGTFTAPTRFNSGLCASGGVTFSGPVEFDSLARFDGGLCAGSGVTFSSGFGATGNIFFHGAQIGSTFGTAPKFFARAWVAFNGTGTVGISGSRNISSVTDNGVGLYTLNFATAMPDVNYAVSGWATNQDNNANESTVVSGQYGAGVTFTASNLTITTTENTSNQTIRFDSPRITVVIYR